MTYVIKESFTNRSGSKVLEKFVREYNRAFIVQGVAANANIDINTILADGTLPQIGTSTYGSDGGALCTGVTWQQSANTTTLIYKYSSDIPISQLRNPDPLARAPVFKFDFQKFKGVLTTDLNGLAVLNSAGQAFENGVELDNAYPVLTIEKNYASFTLEFAQTLLNSINEADWVVAFPFGNITFPKFSCKMDAITINQQEENSEVYYACTYRVIMNPSRIDDDGVEWGLWNPIKVIDSGFAEMFPPLNAPREILDTYGNKRSKASLLDGQGHELQNPSQSNAVWLEFSAYSQQDWSGIP